jgi:chitinase
MQGFGKTHLMLNNGLYQSGKFKRGIPYRKFSELLSEKSGYTSYWDDTAKAPYSYNATEKTLLLMIMNVPLN